MISIERLKVEFGATPLFEDVSFVINKKDRIALVGKNGAKRRGERMRSPPFSSLGGATLLYNALSLRIKGGDALARTLHITIPEDLDYAGVFEPVLSQYTRQYSLTQVKTTNMGSLFKLTYDLTLKDPTQEKGFIDQLRLRNGNLEISLGHQDNAVPTL